MCSRHSLYWVTQDVTRLQYLDPISSRWTWFAFALVGLPETCMSIRCHDQLRWGGEEHRFDSATCQQGFVYHLIILLFIYLNHMWWGYFDLLVTWCLKSVRAFVKKLVRWVHIYAWRDWRCKTVCTHVYIVFACAHAHGYLCGIIGYCC